MQRVFLLLFVFVAFAVPPALADPITVLPISITSGSIVVPDGSVASTINLQGTRDFKMSGFFEGLGQFGGNCHPCLPNTFADLGGFVNELGATAEFTFDGRTIRPLMNDMNSLFHFITGPVKIPAFGLSPVVVSAPFHLEGNFTDFNFENGLLDGKTFPFNGRGTARITLTPSIVNLPDFQFWEFSGSRFDFAPTPVPEPASLVLLGSGLVALSIGRRRAAKERQKAALRYAHQSEVCPDPATVIVRPWSRVTGPSRAN